MKLFDLDTWEEIFFTITRNKARSLLTAFGVFWGIFMLIMLMGGAQGLQKELSRNFEGFATNSGFIATNVTSKPYKGFQQGRTWSMNDHDVIRIRKQVPETDIVTPSISLWGTIVYNENSISGSLKGNYPEYSHIEEPQISIGRYLNDIDILKKRKVCIIGERIYDSLFPNKENPCGKFIQINGIYYQVIGVNSATGNISINGAAETSVTIPFTTMQQNYNLGDTIHLLCYTVKKGHKINQIEEKVESTIKQAHMIHPDDQQAIIHVNTEAMFSMVDNLFLGVKILGWLVGLGTLLAGVIGVSNIMMVTVKERTTEIGIRRAIGARPRDILQQILAESMVLTIIAGFIGILFAIFSLNIFEVTTNTSYFQISFGEAIGACILLLILGSLAGLAPAYRAMTIKPIDAIRDE